jgi:hypothetical protein
MRDIRRMIAAGFAIQIATMASLGLAATGSCRTEIPTAAFSLSVPSISIVPGSAMFTTFSPDVFSVRRIASS